MPEIYIPEPIENPDIYSFGFGRNLYKTKNLEEISLGEQSNDLFYNALSDGISPYQIMKGDIVDTLKLEGSQLFNTFHYGIGDDGNVVISSDTTLTSDMYYDTLIINPGITLNTGGYRVFCKTRLFNNGVITRKGNDGGNALGQIAGSAGAAPSSGSIFGGLAGAASGNGGNTGGAGTAGSIGNAANPSIKGTGDGVVGAAGGAATPGGAGAEGAKGTATQAITNPKNLGFALQMMESVSGTFTLYRGRAGSGGSGGGGGGDIVAVGGGGGGAGSTGGIVWIATRHLTNNGTISAAGGNGGNGANGQNGSSHSGGGGGAGSGGGGGIILLIYQKKDSSGTTNISGGTAGTIGLGGSGGAGNPGNNGGAGTAGSAGLLIELEI